MPETVTLPSITLVLGGARSGKSAYAEGLIEALGGGTYLASGQAFDKEMDERINLHRLRRGSLWETVEEPLEIASALVDIKGPVLVDCLTLWASNLMADGRDIESETAALVRILGQVKGPVVLVSNEVGLGIVPDNALAREFRDHAGRINQAVASVAQKVVFVAAGLPLVMKDIRKHQ